MTSSTLQPFHLGGFDVDVFLAFHTTNQPIFGCLACSVENFKIFTMYSAI